MLNHDDPDAALDLPYRSSFIKLDPFFTTLHISDIVIFSGALHLAIPSTKNMR